MPALRRRGIQAHFAPMSKGAPQPEFDALWNRLAPHVRAAVLRHRWGDASLGADDLVQEVRIRLWQVVSGDRKSRRNASYYYKVVNSAIIDCLRRHRGTLPHGRREFAPRDAQPDQDPVNTVASDAPAPDRTVLDADRAARLRRALARLPEDRARAVGLHLQGFTVAEIAELMGCDHDRAHNLTYRGVRALKQGMKGQSDE